MWPNPYSFYLDWVRDWSAKNPPRISSRATPAKRDRAAHPRGWHATKGPRTPLCQRNRREHKRRQQARKQQRRRSR